MIRQAHLIAVVVAFLIGCAVLLVGCSGAGSEAPQEEEQGHTEATKKEQGRSPGATASEEARCEGTRTIKKPKMATGDFTTNDLPGCPRGGTLLGTDKNDALAGEDGADEVRGLGGVDFIFGGAGNDVIYGGPDLDDGLVGNGGDDVIYGGPGPDRNLRGSEGNDVIYGGPGDDLALLVGGDGQRDELYCGEGWDSYTADKVDYASSSCEKKLPPEEKVEDWENGSHSKMPPKGGILEAA